MASSSRLLEKTHWFCNGLPVHQVRERENMEHYYVIVQFQTTQVQMPPLWWKETFS